MSSNIKIERICEYCGNTFTAQTTVTKYCSHSCASKAYKARKRNTKIDEANTQTTLIKQKVFDNIDSKPYLSISEACKLIGVARQTIYNLIYKGELSMGKFGSRTIIRRTDIDALLNKYTMPTTKSSAAITEYYTAKDIERIYNIKYGRLNEIINKNHIPKKLYKNKLYVSKEHIDKYFTKARGDIENIKTWYSVEQVMNKYAISRDTVYRLTSENHIPKKRYGRYIILSKWHIDELGLLETNKTINYEQE